MYRPLSILGIILLPFLAIGNPADVKPHYDIPSDFWKYLYRDSLPVENPKNIKSYAEITPVYEGEYESGTGETVVYNYNKNGNLTSGSYEYGDAVGGHSFTVELNQYGHPAKIIWTSISPCQDCSDDHREGHTVVTEYVPLYQTPGRIQQIRATTVKAGGKKVNSVSKFLVTPGKDGRPMKLVCLEDNSLKVAFDPNGYPESYNIYAIEAAYPQSRWELQTLQPGETMSQDSISEEFRPDLSIQKDTHGNWIKKSWKEVFSEGEEVETGLFRKITYF